MTQTTRAKEPLLSMTEVTIMKIKCPLVSAGFREVVA